MSTTPTPPGAVPPSREPTAAPSFCAVLQPHRSLSPKGFVLFMSVLGGVSFLTGLMFVRIGAWPVLGFFGLDVAIVYAAFRLNYRSGRLYERVELTPDLLTLTRVHPSGHAEVFEFNPYWVRVRVAGMPDGRTDLRLALGAREWPFGRFLTEDERKEFADHLRHALIEARGGARI